jgi:hypothetical protein
LDDPNQFRAVIDKLRRAALEKNLNRTLPPRPPNMAGGNGEADEHFEFPGGVERRIYRSAHQRRSLLVPQVEVWLLSLEPPLQFLLKN